MFGVVILIAGTLMMVYSRGSTIDLYGMVPADGRSTVSAVFGIWCIVTPRGVTYIVGRHLNRRRR